MESKFIGSSGPMWFAFALMLFCLPLPLFRSTKPSSQGLILKPASFWLSRPVEPWQLLSSDVQPIGSSIFNFQFCFFTQYVVFVLGIVVSRRNGLQSIAESPVSRRAGWLALILGHWP